MQNQEMVGEKNHLHMVISTLSRLSPQKAMSENNYFKVTEKHLLTPFLAMSERKGYRSLYHQSTGSYYAIKKWNTFKTVLNCYKTLYVIKKVHVEKIHSFKVRTAWHKSLGLALMIFVPVAPYVIPYPKILDGKKKLPFLQHFFIVKIHREILATVRVVSLHLLPL